MNDTEWCLILHEPGTGRKVIVNLGYASKRPAKGWRYGFVFSDEVEAKAG